MLRLWPRSPDEFSGSGQTVGDPGFSGSARDGRQPAKKKVALRRPCVTFRGMKNFLKRFTVISHWHARNAGGLALGVRLGFPIATRGIEPHQAWWTWSVSFSLVVVTVSVYIATRRVK